MKRTKILALLLALMMVVSLAACDNARDMSLSASSVDEAEPQSGSEVQDEPAKQDETFASVEAFLENPETKEALNASLLEIADENMSVDVKGTEDSLIYMFTFSEDVMDGLDEDAMIQSLNEGLDTNATVFSEIAGSLADVVDVDNPKVVVIYARPDGTSLVERAFDGGTTLFVEDGAITIETAPEG